MSLLWSKPRQPIVPVSGSRELPPGEFRLAYEYLLGDSRLKRREIGIDAFLYATDERTIEVECELPDEEIGDRDWYLPVAFLARDDVAPYLRVSGCDDAVIPIPTRQQNMALSKLAIPEFLKAEGIELSEPESRELIDEVVTRPPIHARICRVLFELREPAAAPRLERLLKLLEDHFLLWVPVRGEALSRHHISISRRQIRTSDELFRRKGKIAVQEFKTALGTIGVEGESLSGRWVLNRRLALERLLHVFALRPVEADVDEFEASRFASCHLCFSAPTGFVVRNVRAAEMAPDADGGTKLHRRLSRREPKVAIQGYDRELAHVHLARTKNPDHVCTRLTLSLRSGMTTLWMLATVLTAALLWVVHHHSVYGVPADRFPTGHPRFAAAVPDALLAAFNTHAKHIALGANNRQIAAAALLVGPAFASAWSLRAEGGDLLRSALAGSRALLLASAAISVATALALAGILPTVAGRYKAVEIYAAASYVVAVPMVIAWVISSRRAWVLFRSVLQSERRNLLAIVAVSVPLVLVAALPTPGRIGGGVVLACGLSLAAISANSAGKPLLWAGTRYRPLAGFGCLTPLAVAGALLGFYADYVPLPVARCACLGVAALLAAFALHGLARERTGKEESVDETPNLGGGDQGSLAESR